MRRIRYSSVCMTSERISMCKKISQMPPRTDIEEGDGEAGEEEDEEAVGPAEEEDATEEGATIEGREVGAEEEDEEEEGGRGREERVCICW